MTQTIAEPQLLNALHWRYATKVFDPTRKIPADTWQAIEQALVLSPSSFGLQPYRFLVIQDPAIRAALLPVTWNQRQVIDASHYVVFASRNTMTEAEIDQLIELIGSTRGLERDKLAPYRQMMADTLLPAAMQPMIPQWAAHQSYLALGNLLTSAALLGVDACPIEGFEHPEYDRILGLPATGYNATVCCALGYRSATDKYAGLAKVRFPADQLIVHQ